MKSFQRLRRGLLCISCFLLALGIRAQQTDSPAEQLEWDGCEAAHPSCVYAALQGELKSVLEQHSSLLKDSVKLYFRFRIDPKGAMETLRVGLSNQSAQAQDSLQPKVEAFLKGLEPLSVQNPVGGPYPAWHAFSFEYSNADGVLAPIPSETAYTGGVVEQPPMFPDCTPTGFDADIQCFQQQLRAHVAQHFRYPREALEAGIEGRTVTYFKIDEKGRVTDIRSYGGHPSFEAEGIRIISKLPRFRTGLKNGVEVTFDFAIPIAFRLAN